MNAQDWQQWLREWLARHPVKEPPSTVQQRYTEDVMRRIRALEEPAPVFRWVPRPRLTFALATAAVCALALLVVVPRHRTEVAQQPSGAPAAERAEGLRYANIVVEEHPAALTDAEWVDQTFQVLAALETEQGASATADVDTMSEGALLRELELLDREALEQVASS